MSTTEKDGQKKTKSRWDSGVTPYAEMGYWDPDYEPKDTDILCAFRIPVAHLGIRRDTGVPAALGLLLSVLLSGAHSILSQCALCLLYTSPSPRDS